MVVQRRTEYRRDQFTREGTRNLGGEISEEETEIKSRVYRGKWTLDTVIQEWQSDAVAGVGVPMADEYSIRWLVVKLGGVSLLGNNIGSSVGSTVGSVFNDC